MVYINKYNEVLPTINISLIILLNYYYHIFSYDDESHPYEHIIIILSQNILIIILNQYYEYLSISQMDIFITQSKVSSIYSYPSSFKILYIHQI